MNKNLIKFLLYSWINFMKKKNKELIRIINKFKMVNIIYL